MPRKRTGEVRWRNGRASVRLTLRPKLRPSFALTTCPDTAEGRAAADARAATLTHAANRLRRAGQLQHAVVLLRRLARATDCELGTVLQLIDAAVIGQLVGDDEQHRAMTFRELAKQWTSGQLAKLHPDHVKRKRSAKDDAGRLNKHVLPLVGAVPIKDFALEHAEMVMAQLPTDLSRSSRRQVAQVMARILGLAVYPLKLINVSPIPPRWLPSVGRGRVSDVLYPDEDAKLLGCAEVPLPYRVLYGFLAREGMRPGEAAALTWGCLDLQRGTVRLDRNKTREPRSWALSAGVVRALARWRVMRGEVSSDDHVFCDAQGVALCWWHEIGDERRPNLMLRIDVDTEDGQVVLKGAKVLRHHLRVAGVTRAELFEDNDVRMPTRVHDLRGCFVTVALATGRSEAWVSDRTGHTSSQMINRYRRRARRHREARLGELVPLDEAIGELRSGKGTRTLRKGTCTDRTSAESGELINDAGWFRRVDSNHDWRIQSPQSCL